MIAHYRSLSYLHCNFDARVDFMPPLSALTQLRTLNLRWAAPREGEFVSMTRDAVSDALRGAVSLTDLTLNNHTAIDDDALCCALQPLLRLKRLSLLSLPGVTTLQFMCACADSLGRSLESLTLSLYNAYADALLTLPPYDRLTELRLMQPLIKHDAMVRKLAPPSAAIPSLRTLDTSGIRLRY